MPTTSATAITNFLPDSNWCRRRSLHLALHGAAVSPARSVASLHHLKYNIYQPTLFAFSSSRRPCGELLRYRCGIGWVPIPLDDAVLTWPRGLKRPLDNVLHVALELFEARHGLGANAGWSKHQ